MEEVGGVGVGGEMKAAEEREGGVGLCVWPLWTLPSALDLSWDMY